MTVRCNGKQVVEGKLGRVCKPQSLGRNSSRSMIPNSLVPRYDLRIDTKSLGKHITLSQGNLRTNFFREF
jgi:hypothetical protein